MKTKKIVTALMLILFVSTSGSAERCQRVDSNPLSNQDKATLAFMIEEEKLAGDVYTHFLDLYGKRVFQNIASSEERHQQTLREIWSTKYPTESVGSETFGTFNNETLQSLYNSLTATGKDSQVAALQVGALIEETDIQDLARAIDATDDPALQCAYNNLRSGSFNHLRAFTRSLSQLGEEYAPSVLSSEEYTEIVSASNKQMKRKKRCSKRKAATKRVMRKRSSGNGKRWGRW